MRTVYIRLFVRLALSLRVVVPFALFWCVQTLPRAAGIEFEAVSIHRHNSTLLAQPAEINPAQARFIGHSLISLIMYAYSLRLDYLQAPEWSKVEAYDIVAKLPPGSDTRQVPTMLQAMLGTRFELKTHWENIIQPVQLLIVSPSGPTLKKSDDDQVERIFFNLPASRVEALGVTLDALATTLSRCCSDRTILNRTGLPGRFDFRFTVTMERFKSNIVPHGIPDPYSPVADIPAQSLATALSPFGLRLRSTREALRTLVVDSVNKVPSPN